MEFNRMESIDNKGYSKTVLKDLFDRYADENITDEQIAYLLEPILRMIKDGYFDKSYRRQIKRITRKIASLFSNISSLSEDIESKRSTIIKVSSVRK